MLTAAVLIGVLAMRVNALATPTKRAEATDTDPFIWQRTGVSVDMFYDLSHDSVCGRPGAPHAEQGPDWSWTGPLAVNNKPTTCSQLMNYTLAQMENANFISIGEAQMKADPADWCGKEVKLWDHNDKPYGPPDGKKFILWDTCEDCLATADPLIKMSVAAGLPLADKSDCTGTIPKLSKVRVMSNVGFETGPAPVAPTPASVVREEKREDDNVRHKIVSEGRVYWWSEGPGEGHCPRFPASGWLECQLWVIKNKKENEAFRQAHPSPPAMKVPPRN